MGNERQGRDSEDNTVFHVHFGKGKDGNISSAVTVQTSVRVSILGIALEITRRERLPGGEAGQDLKWNDYGV